MHRAARQLLISSVSGWDKRLRGAAHKLGFAYTRYADDLTFSARNKDETLIKKMLWQAKKIVEDEGFIIHPEKERVMPQRRKARSDRHCSQ